MDYQDLVSEFFPCTLISMSKGQYNWDHPDNFIIFNSRIFINKDGDIIKIWSGDIDLTKSWKKLVHLYEKLDGEKLYVCYEGFYKDNETLDNIEKEHCFCVSPSGPSIGPRLQDLYKFEGDKIVHTPLEVEPVPPQVKKEQDDKIKNSYSAAEYKVLADFESVMASKEKKDPISKFWIEIKKLVDVKRVDEVFISHDAYVNFKEQFKKWAKRKHKNLSEYRLNSSVEWTLFDSAPSHFLVDPDWVDKNKVYLKIKE